jgi:hypothetical protein
VKGFDSVPPSKTIFAIKNVGRNHEIGSKNHKKIMDTNIYATEVGGGHVLRPLSKNPHNQKRKEESYLEAINNEKDQAMREPEEFFIHSLVKNLIVLQLGDRGLEEREEGCSTPKKKLTFDLLGGSDGKSQGKWVDANPFETLNKEAGL